MQPRLPIATLWQNSEMTYVPHETENYKKGKKKEKKKVTHDDLNEHAHKALLKLHPFSILRSITLLKDTKVHGFHFATHKDFVKINYMLVTLCHEVYGTE